MTINFYLDSKANNSSDERTVYCYVRGIRPKSTIYLKTPLRISPKYWNQSKQQVRKDYPDYLNVNVFLDKYRNRIKGEVLRILDENPNAGTDKLKNLLKGCIEQRNEAKDLDFYNYLDKFIITREKFLKWSTIQKFNTLKKHLHNVEKKYKYNISFDTMTLEFFDIFNQYLIQDKKLNNNSIHKMYGHLKTFLNWATERGYNNNLEFKKFKFPTYEVDIVYLTENELMRIYKLDLSRNRRLERVRDFFCFGCFTGHRFIDLYNLKKEDIRDNTWYLRVEKTNDILEVPLNRFALSIIDKYRETDFAIPALSNQRTNEYLKELCKIAQIDESIKTTRYSGGHKKAITQPKYELIGTHTARRTFVTLSLEKGMRPEMVMAITGHKNFKTFKKYIKITQKVKKQEMDRVWG